MLLSLRAANVELFEPEGLGLLQENLVVLVGAERLAGGGVLELLLVQDAADFLDHGAELVGDLPVVTVFDLLLILVKGLALLLGHAGAAAEALRGDDDALDAAGHFQAVILDVL